MPKYNERLCLTCSKTFRGPKKSSYRCEEKPEGQLHDVESHAYYAPTKGLTIHYAKETKGLDAQGQQVILDAGADAVFVNGVFTTTDPMAQDFLDGYSGMITFEEWERIHVSKEERAKKLERTTAAQADQLVEKDSEIARLRAQLAAKEATEPDEKKKK